MKTNIMPKFTRAANRAWLKTKKHSPELLLIGGIVAGGAAIFAACRATTEIDTVLATTKASVDQIHECAEAGEITVQKGNEIETVEYTEDDSKKDLFIVYCKAGWGFAKLYGPAIGLSALSLTCILASHGIIHKRNAALMSTVTAIGTEFDEYRGRVVERFGEGLDRELKYNLKAKEVEETVIQEDGTETTVKKTIEVVEDPSRDLSEFARCFCEGCTGWTKDPAANLTFLVMQERFLNDRLEDIGHVFLNEMHDALGLPRTPAGAIMGWIYDRENPRKISLGIHNIHIPANRDFVNGWERSVWIEPNIDKEPIYQKIG